MAARGLQWTDGKIPEGDKLPGNIFWTSRTGQQGRRFGISAWLVSLLADVKDH